MGSSASQAMAAAMAYDMEEELLPFYYSSLINQATNNSIANAAANLPFYAMADMEAEDIMAGIAAGAGPGAANAASAAAGAAAGAGVTPSSIRAITNPQALMITSKWSGEDWR